MKKFAVVLLLFIQFCSGKTLCAQENSLKVTLIVNMPLPAGKYSQDIGQDPQITRRFGFDYGDRVGLANPGYGFGIEMNQQVLVNNLHWITSLRFLANNADPSRVSSAFTDILKDSVDVSFDFGTWINIPVFTGFSYYVDILPNASLYATLQGGINITDQPYRKAIVDGKVVEKTIFRMTPDFGYEIGFGLELFQKYHVGIRYLDLGSPRYDGTRRLNESFFTSIPKRKMNIDGDERPVSLILLYLGYNL